MNDAVGHPGRPRGVLRGRELLIGLPLEPSVELGALTQLLIRRHHVGRAARIGELFGPAAPVGSVCLGERAPGGPALQVAAAFGPEGFVCALAGLRQRDLADEFQRRALAAPDRIPVDQVSGRVAGPQQRGELVDRALVLRRERAVLEDVLDPEVERAREHSRHRQVRRGTDRRQRLDRMQRVDQDEPGAQLGGAPPGEFRQIVQVTVAPRLFRPDRVELHREAPLAFGWFGRNARPQPVIVPQGSRSRRVRVWAAEFGRLLEHGEYGF